MNMTKSELLAQIDVLHARLDATYAQARRDATFAQRESYDALRKRNEELYTEREQLRTQYGEVLGMIATLKQELEEAQTWRGAAERYTEARAQVSRYDIAVKALREQLARRTTSAETCLEENHVGVIAQLKSELDACVGRDEYDALRMSLDETQEILGAVENERDALRSELASAVKAYDDHYPDFFKLTEENKALRDELTALQNRYDAVYEDRERLSVKLVEEREHPLKCVEGKHDDTIFMMRTHLDAERKAMESMWIERQSLREQLAHAQRPSGDEWDVMFPQHEERKVSATYAQTTAHWAQQVTPAFETGVMPQYVDVLSYDELRKDEPMDDVLTAPKQTVPVCSCIGMNNTAQPSASDIEAELAKYPAAFISAEMVDEQRVQERVEKAIAELRRYKAEWQRPDLIGMVCGNPGCPLPYGHLGRCVIPLDSGWMP